MPQQTPDQLPSGRRRSIDEARARPEVAALGEVGGSSLVGYGPNGPSAPTNAVQQLADDTSGGIDEGTFRITFGGYETPDIDVAVTTFNAIIAMLEALPSIGGGNVRLPLGSLSAGPYSFVDNGELDVEFAGLFAGQEVDPLGVSASTLLSNGAPVDPGDFAWTFGPQGAPGDPADFAATALYVQLGNRSIWANLDVGNEVAPTWQQIGYVPPQGQTTATGDPVTIADGVVSYLTWDDLLDPGVLENASPAGPTVLAGGVYAVAATVEPLADLTLGGSYHVVLGVEERDLGEGESAAAKAGNLRPRASVSWTSRIEFGEALRARVTNHDGAAARDFRLRRVTVQRIS